MIIRVEHLKCFTTISNEALRDSRLSWKARGLLAYMLTHSDGYQIRIDNLVEASEPDGPASLATGIKELKTSGYLSYKNRKDTATGLMAGGEWTVYEKPDPRFSGERFFRGAVFPGSGKPRFLKKDQDIRNTKKKEAPSKRRSASFDPTDLPPILAKHPSVVKAWDEFVTHRKEKKCPLTPLAWKKSIQAMLPHPPEVIVAAIDKAVRSGWRGLFFPESKVTPSSRTTATPHGKALVLVAAQSGLNLTGKEADGMVAQMDACYEALRQVKNPRRPDQGPTDLLTRDRFFNGWLDWLRESARTFPPRCSRDLEVGAYRWQEYIRQCEQWTGYDFATGKRRG